MPILLGENFEIYSLAKRSRFLVQDSMAGKIEAEGIHRILVSVGIDPGDPRYDWYFLMITYYNAIHMNAEAKEREKERLEKNKKAASPKSKVLRGKKKHGKRKP